MLNNHNYTNFEINLEVIHVCNKGRYLNALVGYDIYKHMQEAFNDVLNDQLEFKSNQIYHTAISLRKRNKRRRPVMCCPLQCKLCVNNVIVLKVVKKQNLFSVFCELCSISNDLNLSDHLKMVGSYRNAS